MRKNDLFDSIGNVDDELIAKAQQPVRSRKKVFAAIISVAACAVFACAGVLWMSSQGNRNSAENIIADSKVNSYVSSSSVTSAEQYIVSEVSESSGSVGASSGAESSHQQLSQGESRESSAAVSHETHRDESGTGGHVSEVTDVSESSGEESCQESSQEVSEPDYPLDKEIRVYYVDNDTLQTVSLQSSLYSPDVFDTWKSKNHIGDEVEMVNSLYEVGGERITDPHFDMAKAAAPGHEKTLTLVVFISEELENYYTRPDKELLLESLKQTMLSACEYQPDEYRMELWDISQPLNLTTDENDHEESESNRIDPNDVWYNDQGEILE